MQEKSARGLLARGSSPGRTMATAHGKFPDRQIPEPCGFRELIPQSSMPSSATTLKLASGKGRGGRVSQRLYLRRVEMQGPGVSWGRFVNSSLIEFQKGTGPSPDDLPGLRGYVAQLVGEPFQFARVSYGDELTLHFGMLRPARSRKLANPPYGTYILRLRGSPWGDFLVLAAEPGGQSGQFAPQRRRVARQQPQRNT